MTDGELIRKLRKERGIPQSQLAAGISTRTTLSSFENNHSRISSELLFAFLKRMNISVQEYTFYLNNSTKTEKEYALQYFNENIYQAKDYEIQQRIVNYQTKYKDYHDFFFCCLSIELKLFLNKSHDQAVFDVREDTELIKNYLNGIQQWGHFEISLFSNCLYIFSSEYIRGTFNTLFKKTKLLSEIASYKDDIAIFINNCIILSFERQKFQDVQFYTRYLNKISQNSPRKIYDKLMCNYYNELLKDLVIGKSSVNGTIMEFEKLGFAEHAQRIMEFKEQMQILVNGHIK